MVYLQFFDIENVVMCVYYVVSVKIIKNAAFYNVFGVL